MEICIYKQTNKQSHVYMMETKALHWQKKKTTVLSYNVDRSHPQLILNHLDPPLDMICQIHLLKLTGQNSGGSRELLVQVFILSTTAEDV